MDAGDVNATDEYGNTALHDACKATNTKNDRVLEALLAFEGIDPCIANDDDNTPVRMSTCCFTFLCNGCFLINCWFI